MKKDWRYERKFTIEDLTFDQVEDSILENTYLFSEIFHGRQVNNIYFDDINYSAYHSNIEGLSERKKYRVRWYGQLFGSVIDPVLEAKVRKSNLGTKFHFKINNFEIRQRFDSNSLMRNFIESNLSENIINELSLLTPSLINSYYRNYYLSKNGQYRVTIDRNLSYYHVTPNINNVLTKNDQKGIVVEVKYAVEDDESIDSITNQFPFRLSRNSKYVKGFSIVNDLIY